MSESHRYSADYYQTLPHLRLSKRKYLVLDGDQLFHLKIHSGISNLTFLFRIDELIKISVQMHRSKYGSTLNFTMLRKTGQKKNYVIQPQKIGYRVSDWIQIPEFLRNMEFLPSPNPPTGLHLEDIQSQFQVFGPYRYFSSQDPIFRLFENPVFVEELTLLPNIIIPIILLIVGGICLTMGVAIVLINYSPLMLILPAPFILVLLYAIPRLLKYSRLKQAFVAKYHIGYYFK